MSHSTYTQKPEPGPAPERPAWLAPRLAAMAAAAFFAAFVVIFWVRALWREGQPVGSTENMVAIFVGIVFAASACMTPIFAPKIMHAAGWARAGLIFVVAVFAAVDSGGFTLALWGVEREITDRDHGPAAEIHAARLSDADRLVADLQRKLADLPTPDADGAIRRGETYATAAAALERQLQAAKASRKALGDGPVRADLFDDGLVALVATAIQIALIVAFLSIEAGRDRAYSHAVARRQAIYDAAMEAYQDGRAKAADKRKRTIKRKAKVQKRREADAPALRLVANE